MLILSQERALFNSRLAKGRTLSQMNNFKLHFFAECLQNAYSRASYRCGTSKARVKNKENVKIAIYVNLLQSTAVNRRNAKEENINDEMEFRLNYDKNHIIMLR